MKLTLCKMCCHGLRSQKCHRRMHLVRSELHFLYIYVASGTAYPVPGIIITIIDQHTICSITTRVYRTFLLLIQFPYTVCWTLDILYTSPEEIYHKIVVSKISSGLFCMTFL